MPAGPAHLPDPVVGSLQCSSTNSIRARCRSHASVVSARPWLAGPLDGVHQLAVHVELELAGGRVADPHRREPS